MGMEEQKSNPEPLGPEDPLTANELAEIAKDNMIRLRDATANFSRDLLNEELAENLSQAVEDGYEFLADNKEHVKEAWFIELYKYVMDADITWCVSLREKIYISLKSSYWYAKEKEEMKKLVKIIEEVFIPRLITYGKAGLKLAEGLKECIDKIIS
jgi:predicted S18 family serine protease